MREEIVNILQGSPRGVSFFFVSSILSDYKTKDVADCMKSMINDGIISMDIVTQFDAHGTYKIQSFKLEGKNSDATDDNGYEL